jgi:hypothetical protein
VLRQRRREAGRDLAEAEESDRRHSAPPERYNGLLQSS